MRNVSLDEERDDMMEFDESNLLEDEINEVNISIDRKLVNDIQAHSLDRQAEAKG